VPGVPYEHKGPDARLVVLDERKFDHQQTDYLLKGKHLETECNQCHRPATKYRNAQAACIACHTKMTNTRASWAGSAPTATRNQLEGSEV